MHLFAPLSGPDVMGSNKAFIHSFITSGKIDLIALHRGHMGVDKSNGGTDAHSVLVVVVF